MAYTSFYLKNISHCHFIHVQSGKPVSSVIIPDAVAKLMIRQTPTVDETKQTINTTQAEKFQIALLNSAKVILTSLIQKGARQ